MLDPVSLVAIICAYIGLLFGVAVLAERKTRAGSRSWAQSPVVYSLSLAVYCTSWTYYGSVGNVVDSGLLYMTIHLGPTLGTLLWWPVLRKMVRIKSTHRITSIADFVSARYDRSQALAAIATGGALVGSLPYIALQLRAIISTFELIAKPATESLASGLIRGHLGIIVVSLMSAFTIIFGVRRIDPTERHQGIVTAVAFESVVKLVAFLVVGLFATYGVFGGPEQLLQRLQQPSAAPYMQIASNGGRDYTTWMTYLLLATSAIYFLPRQFHVGVVENSNEKHIASAMWLFPLYLILINLFVVPIAMAGLEAGIPPELADTYVLQLPLRAGRQGLALAAFIGGFSAATSMVMISAMTLSTMLTNHLLLPLAPRHLPLMRGHVLQLRWLAVIVCITAGYGFERLVGDSFKLIGIGIISFAAALQFAPAILFGLFWQRASRQGAMAGLTAGFCIWLYTLFIPAIAKGGYMSGSLLTDGPAGIGWLRPQALFGLAELPSMTHSVFWSLLFNVGLLVAVSLSRHQTAEQQRNAVSFVHAFATPFRPRPEDMPSLPRAIELASLRERITRMLAEVLPQRDAMTICDKCVASTKLQSKQDVSILEASELVGEVEKWLTGSLGAATAYRIIRNAHLFTAAETEALKQAYSELVARMNVSPDELLRKVDHYREKGDLLAQHARELEHKIRERDSEIDQRQRVETALRAAEERYRSIFENAIEGIFQAHPDGRIVTANPALAGIFRYGSPEQLLARVGANPALLFVVPTHYQQFLAEIEQAGEVTGRELQCRRADGETIWVLINGRRASGASDVPLVEGSIEDITESRLAAEALRESEQRYRDLFETASDLVQITDMAGRIVYANRAWRQTLGLEPSAEQPVAFGQFVHQEAQADWDEAFERMRAGDEVAQLESMFVTPSGREIFVEGSLSCRVEDGRPVATRGIFRDVTERKAVDRMKSEFISVVSHELRTPLTSVRGSLGLLEGGVVGKLSPKGLELVQIARSNSDRLIRLVNDILDLEKIEAGKAELASVSLRAGDIIRRTLDGLTSVAADAAVTLTRKDGDQLQLWGDPDRLVQVLTNLLGNAIKFSPPGATVWVGCELAGTRSVRFEVRDEGPGIAQDQQETLFQKFHQLDASDSRQKGGTGLGLAICKAIVEQHGGTIGVESDGVSGTVFYFTIPQRPRRRTTGSVPGRLLE